MYLGKYALNLTLPSSHCPMSELWTCIQLHFGLHSPRNVLRQQLSISVASIT